MNYKKTKLKNGLTVLTIPMKDTQTATVVIMVGVGSRYETEKEAGLSHFIEHMFFKGTKRRPTTLAIAEELDSIGGEFNAFTSKDHTGYYAKADFKHIETALDVVSDMYLNSKMEAEEIEREKGTIIQELNMYEDNPMRTVSDVFENLLYKSNSLGRDIIGYKKALETFDAILPSILAKLSPDDILILTADHGCDPTWRGSDHTREHIPFLMYHNNGTSRDLGIRTTYADIGQTVAKHLNLPSLGTGTSAI